MIYPYGLYYDPLILAVIAVFILGLIAQGRVTRTFSKYSKEPASSGLTGQEVAQRLLDQGGSSVTIRPVNGSLTDHFDPRTGVISLSAPVYNVSSISAVGVAAHEAGHAIQHAVGYLPNRIRSFLVPVTNFGSRLSMPLILIGLLLPVQYDFVVLIGIALYSLMVLFQLVTLPVEFNASRRAVRALDQAGVLYPNELAGAEKVLRAAALT